MHKETEQLVKLAKATVAEAIARGASDAEVWISGNQGFEVGVRNGAVEQVEFNRDTAIVVKVYSGQSQGVASGNDQSPEALQRCVTTALQIAEFTEPDSCAGLAPAERLAEEGLELELHHQPELDVTQATDFALRAEAACLAADPELKSDGAGYSSFEFVTAYANSRGFAKGYPSSRYSANCVVIVTDGDDMQRDYWYSQSRAPEKLQEPEEIGAKAAERVLARTKAKPVAQGQYPILLAAEVARSIFGHLIGAISGSSLYRRSSFLLDKKGSQLFPQWLSLVEDPHLLQGLNSRPFDDDGVATRARRLVDGGVLTGYLLSHYSACRLDTQTTGNAGGVGNLLVEAPTSSFTDLLQQLGTGLLVTDLMGHGVNMVTGDYSRGASGFWVEDGEIQHYVREFTIAGNLMDMFANLQAVGDDVDYRSGTLTGSLLFAPMMVGA